MFKDKEIKIKYKSNARFKLFEIMMDYFESYEFFDKKSKNLFEKRVVNQVEGDVIIKFNFLHQKEDLVITVIVLDLGVYDVNPTLKTFNIILTLKKDYIFKKGGE